MISFLRKKIADRSPARDEMPLGHLELQLMEILWSRGECNVREVTAQLDRQLAYTTVMTTLDRLFKKGLLERRKSDRAFIYSARMSRLEWARGRAGNLIANFLAGPHPSRDLLVSSFLDAVGERDAMLLDELEKKIRTKRKELFRRGQP